MGAEIDRLEVQVEAQASKANQQLDKLINRLDRVSSSLMAVNGRGLATMGAGVNKLANSMNNFSNRTKTADFSRLARNISSIGSIDASSISRAAGAISSISSSVGKIGNVSQSAEQFGTLARGIAQLGYKSSTKAIENIPQLAVAMKQLMKTLSNAPRVSQNLIDMTNALAKLSRTGASSGRAANSLAKSLNVFSSSSSRAQKSSRGLASAFGKLYAGYWLLFRAFGKIGDAINISSDLTEVQNVVDVTFGKYSKLVDEMASTSIQDYGMSELTVKKIASRYQAMGTAMGFTQGKMADMSIGLTKLAADMASFYNGEQKDVAEDLESIFTGQTRPLRTYGLDLTEATLKEWAMKQGIDANIDSMEQMEKTMLRYQYVMSNTGAAQGDFTRTSDTWANQTRILKQQFEQLSIIVGGVVINSFKPLISTLNIGIGKFNEFALAISNALGKIFGWTYEISNVGVTDGLTEGIEDTEAALNSAISATKELKRQLMKFDEINKLDDNSSSDGGSGSGANNFSNASGTQGTVGKWVETEKFYESFIDDLEGLGEYINKSITNVLTGIDWNNVYVGAKNFGKGLANFLNGLISPQLFGSVGKTIAGALNTAIYAQLSFTNTYDFEELGNSIAQGINDFVEYLDTKAGAETLNKWVDGFTTTIKTAADKIDWGNVFSKVEDFFYELDIDTVGLIIGTVTIKKFAPMAFATLGAKLSEALSSVGGLKNILTMDLSAGLTGASFATIGSTIVTGIIGGITAAWGGWNIGQWLYEKLSGDIIDMSFGEQMAYLADTILTGEFFPALGDILVDGLKAVFNWDETMDLFTMAGESFEMVADAFKEKDWGAIAKNILDGIALGFTGILDFFVEPINDLFKTIWNGICKVFGIHSPAKEVKPLGEYILKGLINGFVSGFSDIPNTMRNMFSSFENSFNNLKSSSWTWGKDMIQGFTNGINSMKSNLKKTVEGVAESIKRLLHFSRPDEGPLRNYETWMPDFMQGLANGVNQNKHLVTSAITSLANDMRVEAATPIGFSVGRSYMPSGVNASSSIGNDGFSGEIRRMTSALEGARASGVTTVVVNLQGDAKKFFTAMQEEANDYTNTTGLSPFPV